jgi:type II secretory pathway pseudopilin PulG
MDIIKKRESSQKGITLIEILIGVSISSLVMLALLSLYIDGQKYFFNQGAKADTIEDSSTPNEWISRDIRSAIQAVGTYAGSDETYSTSSDTLSDTLVLQIPSVDDTESIISGSSDYIIYRQNPDHPNFLERIIDADDLSVRSDSTRIMADDVNSMTFRYYDTSGIEITGSYEDSFNIHFEIVSTRKGLWRGSQPYQETFRSWAKIRSKAF